MKIITMLVLLVILPACVHPQKEVKQYRGMSEPAERYAAAILIKCDDFAMQNAITAAKNGYSETEIMYAYKLAQDACLLKEKRFI